MVDFTSYPMAVDIGFLCLVFAIALAISHAVLLPWLGHDEVRWQYIDYLWLPLVLIGLTASVQQNRAEVSSNFEEIWRQRADSQLRMLRNDLIRYGRDSSYLCAPATRGPLSPPPEIFDAIEKDDSETCRWTAAVLGWVPKDLNSVTDDFSIASLPPVPQLSGHSGTGPSDAIANVKNGVARVIEARERIKNHQTERRASEVMGLLKFLGPFVLAVALALRITKVSGEIRIKKAKQAGL